jgi:hypothetical protein
LICRAFLSPELRHCGIDESPRTTASAIPRGATARRFRHSLVVPEQRQKKNDRQRNAEQPE